MENILKKKTGTCGFMKGRRQGNHEAEWRQGLTMSYRKCGLFVVALSGSSKAWEVSLGEQST